jgi:hypothetical protein
VLNGEKRWITNGSLAHVLTVMARTPVPGSKETKITAFIVTPDMPGFEVTEARMPKCGVRGTATSRLAFRDMFVPRENVLGQLGKGLKVALTVLDFGRTTFGATCTGAAKFCAERAAKHAATRIQFGQPIGEFELVKEKLAFMNAGIFAMEAATYLTAALIDSGQDDYILETAMLKVFATDTLWRIINDAIQIFGGKAYFTDEPYERMMRDARINMIGEGANDVLRAFVALVGMRDVGMELQSVLAAFKRPLKHFGKLSDFVGRRVESLFRAPDVSVTHAELELDAQNLGKIVAHFGAADIFGELDRDPERLREVRTKAGRAISRKRVERAIAAWRQVATIREVETFLFSHGIAAGLAGRLVREYGDEVVDVLTHDPYRLIELPRVGFKTADRIARSLGIELDDPQRLRAGLRFALEESEADGNTFLPVAELWQRAGKLLEVSDVEPLESALRALVAEAVVVIERDRVYRAELWEMERRLAATW